MAWVPRYDLERLDGNGSDELALRALRPRTVRSVTIDGVAATPANFDLYDDGRITARSGSFPAPGAAGRRNCVIGYEHGAVAPPPELRRVALVWIRRTAMAHAHGQNLDVPQAQDGYTSSYIAPDPAKGKPTGMAVVDAVLNDLARQGRIPGIG